MTLQQIAERAGVSTPTISKVLNGRPDVAPATRERVLQVLHEQQYLPRGASALPSAHQHVELVFDALKNPNNLEILREIVKAAGEHGGHVAVSTVPENMNARRWIHELERVGRAGVIMVTSRLTPEQQRRLQEAALPLVLIDPINSVDGPVPSVGATNWRGGVTAVQHLLELGHRRIAMLRGYECLVDDARYHGYAAAITEAGIALDPVLVERADFRFEPAVLAAEKILRLPDRPTGMFAANDLEALGVIEAARRLGLGVPRRSQCGRIRRQHPGCNLLASAHHGSAAIRRDGSSCPSAADRPDRGTGAEHSSCRTGNHADRPGVNGRTAGARPTGSVTCGHPRDSRPCLRSPALLEKDLNVPRAQLDRLIRREGGVGAKGGDRSGKDVAGRLPGPVVDQMQRTAVGGSARDV